MDDPLGPKFERRVRRTLRLLAKQRVGLVLQPGNVWVIENSLPDDDDTDAAVKTAWMRGWVEPIEHAVPRGYLGPNGELPTGALFQGTSPLWRLTEGGWAVINRTKNWNLFAILIAVLSLVVALYSMLLSASTASKTNCHAMVHRFDCLTAASQKLLAHHRKPTDLFQYEALPSLTRSMSLPRTEA